MNKILVQLKAGFDSRNIHLVGANSKRAAAIIFTPVAAILLLPLILPRGSSRVMTVSVSAAPSPPVFVRQWGGPGTGQGLFHLPAAVALDPSANVYVADSVNNLIQKFDSNGNFITQWGGPGSGQGLFKFPHGVALDTSNNVYVVDRFNSLIQKFDSNGNFITQWGGFGALGNGQFLAPNGVAVDAQGRVYVADNDRIQKFDSNGNFIKQWGGFGLMGHGLFFAAAAVAVDGSGNVYAVDSCTSPCPSFIQKFDSNGNFITQWGGPGSGQGLFSLPGGLGTDSSGNVYLADAGNDLIQKFDSNGNFILQWGGPGAGQGLFNVPNGVAVDGSGNVYVDDGANNLIQKFSPVPVGPSLDTCLKDNVTGWLFQWDSTTGQYQFTRCSDNFSVSGTGVVSVVNGIRMLTDRKPDRRINAGFNTAQLTGSATIYLNTGGGIWQVFRVNDTNPSAVCQC